MSISQVSAQQSLRATMAVAALRKNSSVSDVTGTTTSRQADAINLSDVARALASARTSVSNAPEVREDRVAALKAAIASGTYSVSSRDLAQSMIKRSWSA